MYINQASFIPNFLFFKYFLFFWRIIVNLPSASGFVSWLGFSSVKWIYLSNIIFRIIKKMILKIIMNFITTFSSFHFIFSRKLRFLFTSLSYPAHASYPYFSCSFIFWTFFFIYFFNFIIFLLKIVDSLNLTTLSLSSIFFSWLIFFKNTLGFPRSLK